MARKAAKKSTAPIKRCGNAGRVEKPRADVNETILDSPDALPPMVDDEPRRFRRHLDFDAPPQDVGSDETILVSGNVDGDETLIDMDACLDEDAILHTQALLNDAEEEERETQTEFAAGVTANQRREGNFLEESRFHRPGDNPERDEFYHRIDDIASVSIAGSEVADPELSKRKATQVDVTYGVFSKDPEKANTEVLRYKDWKNNTATRWLFAPISNRMGRTTYGYMHYDSCINRVPDKLTRAVNILEQVMANRNKELAALIAELEFQETAVFMETTEFIFSLKNGEYGHARVSDSPLRVTGRRPDDLPPLFKVKKTGAPAFQ
ncbi:Oidioi.mRNA.OKI2018_I69.PAR.g12693.t1.cds [Oikopleura dioica]|uniref:Oidioi.mRNA.OKI2018_I69.PAR.g12693.t1.cds n=1 Tax=Oikopleura dioica TaxID=34765 RepID=A0ABN7S154_OIKDI|nr:Oidioi.mRNA.OKI2018_I69.PAR.g12693.t1.cds [Oikopleura dioica]